MLIFHSSKKNRINYHENEAIFDDNNKSKIPSTDEALSSSVLKDSTSRFESTHHARIQQTQDYSSTKNDFIITFLSILSKDDTS